MQIQNNRIIFLTGKRIYSNNGIIGLSPKLEVTEGYDGDIEIEDLTKEERLELAEYMLKKWTEFRNTIGGREALTMA
jgi:hypothetical protein